MKPALVLYRNLLKVITKLPPESRDYYRTFTKESFITFSDEADPGRVSDLIARGKEHAIWILKKAERVETGECPGPEHVLEAIAPPMAAVTGRGTAAEGSKRGTLLEGLPDDLAKQCLYRVPAQHVFRLRGVCKLWRALTCGPALFSERATRAVADHWVIALLQCPTTAVTDGEDKAAAGSHECSIPGCPKKEQRKQKDQRELQVQVLDLRTGQWLRDIPRLPAELRAGFDLELQVHAHARARRMYVVGGTRDAISVWNPVWCWDIASMRWEQKASIPRPLVRFHSGVLGDTLWVAGSLEWDNEDGKLTGVYVYNAERDSWKFVEGSERSRAGAPVEIEEKEYLREELYMGIAVEAGLLGSASAAQKEWLRMAKGSFRHYTWHLGELYLYSVDRCLYRYVEDDGWAQVAESKEDAFTAGAKYFCYPYLFGFGRNVYAAGLSVDPFLALSVEVVDAVGELRHWSQPKLVCSGLPDGAHGARMVGCVAMEL
eukprot:jgi/Mesen1/5601/ME000282S04756